MAKYVIPLTDEEELNLRQFTKQPVFPVVLKLLQQLAFDEQNDLMEAKEKTKEAELLNLLKARATKKAVDAIARKLMSYCDMSQPEQADELDPLKEMWN